MNPILHHFGF